MISKDDRGNEELKGNLEKGLGKGIRKTFRENILVELVSELGNFLRKKKNRKGFKNDSGNDLEKLLKRKKIVVQVAILENYVGN